MTRTAFSSVALLSVAVALCSAACAGTQQARLYDMRNGQSSGLTVNRAYLDSGTVSGSLPEGESCNGRFSEVPVDLARKLGTADLLYSENAESSVALLTCSSGKQLRCSMVRRPGEGFSYGACKDQQGTEYDMMF